MLTTKDTARNPIDAKCITSIDVNSVTLLDLEVLVFNTKMLIELFSLPVIFPQTTVHMANVHILPAVGMLAHVTLV